ncbi:MAG: S-methyl-5-thioribose-1-phosphate isomerase, partial [Candidatus Omnitrophica bacterium]|nr:S-methyl-5-thioribose-1-phosphate isomerase [Candidatus Omnitrophota bacterium]
MRIKSIDWQNNKIKIIDQTRLPKRLEYLYVNDIRMLWRAIRQLKVRGAPALGAAAALGVYLGIRDFKGIDLNKFFQTLKKVSRYIASSRPTARNLFWGLERMNRVSRENKHKSINRIKFLLLKEAKEIIEEDRLLCRKIGSYGEKLISSRDSILTICNAGILATVDYGTALGVIYAASARGKKISVYSCETRPLLQGARLTTWELKRQGIDVTLICDSMAAVLMQQGKIDKVIVGADRIAANGDTANKIGTYALAVLCRQHNIPFYVAAPYSTFDLSIKSGKEINIEQRPAEEITTLFFKYPMAAGNIKVF